jgi:hypothetical protein
MTGDVAFSISAPLGQTNGRTQQADLQTKKVYNILAPGILAELTT